MDRLIILKNWWSLWEDFNPMIVTRLTPL